MERIIPTEMTGTVNATYEAGLTSIVNYITNTKGAYAIVDPHNFARYYGNIITVSSRTICSKFIDGTVWLSSHY